MQKHTQHGYEPFFKTLSYTPRASLPRRYKPTNQPTNQPINKPTNHPPTYPPTHQVRKSALAVELRCPTRDLRILDTSFPSAVAAFLARRGAIVLRCDRVRAVVRPDELMVFDPHSKDSASLLLMVQQQLTTVAALKAQQQAGGAVVGENHIHYYQQANPLEPAALTAPGVTAAGMSSSSGEGGGELVVSPFELLALEAVLANACHALHERLQSLTPPIARILRDLRFRHGTLSSFPKLLDELLPLRNDLAELHYAVQEIRKVSAAAFAFAGCCCFGCCFCCCCFGCCFCCCCCCCCCWCCCCCCI